MHNTTQEIHIRIFSGNHIGAEISVSPGKYIFGNDDTCDFIISDPCMAAHHFSLEIAVCENSESAQTTAVKITPLEGKLSVNEENISEECLWEKEQLLSAQGILFAWTDENMEILVQKSKVSMLPHSKENPNQISEKENANNNGTDNTVTETTDNNVVIKEEHSENYSASQQDAESKKKKFLGIIISVIAVLVLTVTFTPIENSEFKDVKNIENLLQQNGFQNIQVIVSDKGILWQGILENDGERAKLHSLAQSMQFPVYLDIMVKSDIAKTFKNIFAIKKLYPTVRTADNSNIFLGYYVKDRLYEQIAMNTLKDMLPHYDEIQQKLTVKTVYADELTKILNEKKQKYNIKNLDPAFEEGQLIFSRMLSQAEQNQIQAIMDELNAELGFSVPYQFLTAEIQQEKRQAPQKAKTAPSAKQNTLSDFAVTSVNTGAIPFITLSNNEKVFIGGILPNGGTLEKITLHELTINHNGSITIYPLRGN